MIPSIAALKFSLICRAKEAGVYAISAMGAGNKLDPTRFEVADIAKTSVCPLCRVMRTQLKKRGVTHHTVVFSPEEPMEPEQLEAPPPGRRSVPGSLVWLPASAGLLLCQHVVTELIK